MKIWGFEVNFGININKFTRININKFTREICKKFIKAKNRTIARILNQTNSRKFTQIYPALSLEISRGEISWRFKRSAFFAEQKNELKVRQHEVKFTNLTNFKQAIFQKSTNLNLVKNFIRFVNLKFSDKKFILLQEIKFHRKFSTLYYQKRWQINGC